MLRKVWKDCYEYLRILEILNDYWIQNPDEAEVRVEMYFRHRNGEVQEKRIIWRNPHLRSEHSEMPSKKSAYIKKLSEVQRPITR